MRGRRKVSWDDSAPQGASTVTLDEVRRQLARVLDGTRSRADVGAWAREVRVRAQDGAIRYEPPEDRERIAEWIARFVSVDLCWSSGAWLVADDELNRWRVKIGSVGAWYAPLSVTRRG